MSNRLLVFTENYAQGGGNRYMVDLVNSISIDFDQVVIASNKDGVYSSDLARLMRPAETICANVLTRASFSRRLSGAPGWLRRLVSLALIALEPLLMLFNVVLLARLIGKVRPSLILSCNGGYPAAQACLAMVLAARLRRVKVVLSIVSMPSPRRAHLWPCDRLLDALVWRFATMIVVNAAAIATGLTRLRSLPAGRAVVLHNGIEDRASSELGRHEEGSFVIGCVARLEVMKGALVLLDAFIELARERSDVCLVLAGEGDASVEIKSRLADANLLDRVTLLGHFTGDVDALLRTFDVFAFPSFWEGFPYSVIEAMRASRAIVATDVGGIPEALVHEREGILVAPRSRDALLAGLRLMLDDADLRRALAGNARHRFVEEFSLDQMHRKVRESLRVS